MNFANRNVYIKLVGHLTSDPELAISKNSKGKERFVCWGSIAQNVSYKLEPDYYNFEIWGSKALKFANEAKKDDLIELNGEVRSCLDAIDKGIIYVIEYDILCSSSSDTDSSIDLSRTYEDNEEKDLYY